jgi:hypothetical protein
VYEPAEWLDEKPPDPFADSFSCRCLAEALCDLGSTRIWLRSYAAGHSTPS